MSQIIYKNESYFVIGLCMDIHNERGKGFSEVVYSDAPEIELKSNGVPFKKEVKFDIIYKGKKLKHHYYADYLVDDKIILELKAVEKISSAHVKQTLNYLAASKMKLGLSINFGEDSLSYKRVIL
ncbi:GxxExxY protein [[Muricauda] lutisoli]|uniref:GxxExxY protein n=1 Tax=[Muricauda] lutisoli TaxID=2816035 RepID=A0ABS3F0F0_9FLAO|nr:GxxExxY protein [[Muricauda] lutisoli]MBO0331616.1 GxxExxY protein [[Muricauda] lutisoli]